MPEIGEIRKDVYGTTRNRYYIWTPCSSCGKGRWIQRSNVKRSILCRVCHLKEKVMPAGKDHPSWKGGKWKHEGYVLILLDKDSPFYPMTAKNGSVPEHRLIMAKYLNRCLLKTEQVHHLNGIRDDNRRENLELISPANHTLYKQMCSKCSLRKQIRLLKQRIKELQSQAMFAGTV